MGISCECCKRYSKHVHVKVKCFVSQMNSESKHSMVIPQSFVNQFAWKISGTIRLEAPDGNIYDVGVTEHWNKTVLQSGWEAFVDANHIVEDDSMMFRYRGSSCFKVVVFDPSGCEKVTPCTGIGENTTGVEEPTTNSTDMSSSSFDGNTQLSTSGRSDGCQSGRSDGCQSESSGYSRKRAKFPATPYSSKESGENASAESSRHEVSSESLESKKSDGPSKPPYFLSLRSCLSRSQKKIVEEKVQAIQSEVPICVSIMSRSNIGHNGMEFCSPYAAAHLPHINQVLVLQRRGEIWETKMTIRTGRNGKRWCLRGGWPKFSRDNHLRVGDICLFELKKNRVKLTMVVHIISSKQC